MKETFNSYRYRQKYNEYKAMRRVKKINGEEAQ